MKRLIIGGLAALAIGLTGTATAEDVPSRANPAGTPFSIANLLPNSATPSKSPCLMFVPGQWTCPEGFSAPRASALVCTLIAETRKPSRSSWPPAASRSGTK